MVEDLINNCGVISTLWTENDLQNCRKLKEMFLVVGKLNLNFHKIMFLRVYSIKEILYIFGIEFQIRGIF
jgi:hypothetical protein